jgi:hypothetical protein
LVIVGRKNHNSAKGKNGGKRYARLDAVEELDVKSLWITLNEDAKVFTGVRKV